MQQSEGPESEYAEDEVEEDEINELQSEEEEAKVNLSVLPHAILQLADV